MAARGRRGTAPRARPGRAQDDAGRRRHRVRREGAWPGLSRHPCAGATLAHGRIPRRGGGAMTVDERRRWVEYHADEWKDMVEQGWVTVETMPDDPRVVLMLKQGAGR